MSHLNHSKHLGCIDLEVIECYNHGQRTWRRKLRTHKKEGMIHAYGLKTGSTAEIVHTNHIPKKRFHAHSDIIRWTAKILLKHH